MDTSATRGSRADFLEAIVDAASRRGVPVSRVAGSSFLLLGRGRRLQLVRDAVTSRTSHLAVEIAADHGVACALLAGAGLPVPTSRIVASASEAVAAAREMGGRVVVRPVRAARRDESPPRAVAGDEVRAAFERARRHGRVMVERHLEGMRHQVIVVDGSALVVVRRTPPQVRGDGVRKVQRLVADENAGRARGIRTAPIAMDAVTQQVLARQGLALDAVPPAGMTVLLRDDTALATGGRAKDVTASTHASVKHACVRAAGAIGLDVAGIDLTCRDISRPLEPQGGGITGVDASPDVPMHGDAVANAILAMLFPAPRRH